MKKKYRTSMLLKDLCRMQLEVKWRIVMSLWMFRTIELDEFVKQKDH
ncbi:MAG: hypothetical protein IPO27_13090 [Bacteroidetes bacterium]|nr:hypothetical protein [Bacteroidota bacterium]